MSCREHIVIYIGVTLANMTRDASLGTGSQVFRRQKSEFLLFGIRTAFPSRKIVLRYPLLCRSVTRFARDAVAYLEAFVALGSGRRRGMANQARAAFVGGLSESQIAGDAP
jgi:hypothetical protein